VVLLCISSVSQADENGKEDKNRRKGWKNDKRKNVGGMMNQKDRERRMEKIQMKLEEDGKKRSAQKSARMEGKRKRDEEAKRVVANAATEAYLEGLREWDNMMYEEASESFYKSLLLSHRMIEIGEGDSLPVEKIVTNYLLCFKKLGRPADGFLNMAVNYEARGQMNIAKEYRDAATTVMQSPNGELNHSEL